MHELIDAWNDRHRSRLIGPAQDPGTFFVKTAKITSANTEYSQNTFFEAWRTVIQRYEIYNPWTRRGAIKGLLPHGPHIVRDVLATHILKQTGSYEQASYAIQDTPEVVAKHYGRFLPQDKAEIAARILNKVWDAASRKACATAFQHRSNLAFDAAHRAILTSIDLMPVWVQSNAVHRPN